MAAVAVQGLALVRVARRQRQAAGREAMAGRLAAALLRVEQLEDLVRSATTAAEAAAASGKEEAAPAAQVCDPCRDEVVKRLALAEPILRAGVEAALAAVPGAAEAPPLELPQVQISRRNAGLHAFAVTADAIAAMSQPQLNTLQRGARRKANNRIGEDGRILLADVAARVPPPVAARLVPAFACRRVKRAGAGRR